MVSREEEIKHVFDLTDRHPYKKECHRDEVYRPELEHPQGIRRNEEHDRAEKIGNVIVRAG